MGLGRAGRRGSRRPPCRAPCETARGVPSRGTAPRDRAGGAVARRARKSASTAVVGAGIDRSVKGGIGPRIGLRVAGPGEIGHGFVQGVEAAALERAHRLGRRAGRRLPLDLRHRDEEFGELARRDLRHHRAAARAAPRRGPRCRAGAGPRAPACATPRTDPPEPARRDGCRGASTPVTIASAIAPASRSVCVRPDLSPDPRPISPPRTARPCRIVTRLACPKLRRLRSNYMRARCDECMQSNRVACNFRDRAWSGPCLAAVVRRVAGARLLSPDKVRAA